MTFYFGLLGFIYVVAIASSFAFPDKKERENFILKVGMFAVYIVLALKKYTVGIDIPGYRRQYYLSKLIPFEDFDFVYYEKGYVFFMKIFAKLNLDFQVFMIVIYTFVCIVLYHFIKRYSKNVTLSLTIFICYQVFVFYNSGVRQTIAMTWCLLAFMILNDAEEKTIGRLLAFIVCVVIGATFHNSAYIFFMVIPFIYAKMNKYHLFMYIPMLLASVFIRPLLFRILGVFFKGLTLAGGITLKGNFIFQFLFVLLGIIAIIQFQPGSTVLKEDPNEENVNIRFLYITINMLLSLLVIQVLFSGNSILRSAMYLSLFFIPGLTNILKCFDNKLEIVATWVFFITFILIFYFETLAKNQLNIIPYLFFWQ